MEIEEILQKHSFEVEGLLRRHKVVGALNMDTVKRAYDKKGEPFMMDLLKIITPTSNFLGIGKGNGFLGLGKAEPTTAAGFTYDPYADPLSDESLNAAIKESQPAATGSTWGWWDKLLNTVTKTGNTYATVKNQVNGQTAANEQAVFMANQQTAQNNSLIYMAAGALVLIIIIILLFKK